MRMLVHIQCNDLRGERGRKRDMLGCAGHVFVVDPEARFLGAACPLTCQPDAPHVEFRLDVVRSRQHRALCVNSREMKTCTHMLRAVTAEVSDRFTHDRLARVEQDGEQLALVADNLPLRRSCLPTLHRHQLVSRLRQRRRRSHVDLARKDHFLQVCDFQKTKGRRTMGDPMAAVPTAVPVVMGVPAQLEMDGGKSPLDASGFQSADVHQWDGQPWQVVGEDSQTLLATLQPGQVRTCLRSRLCSTYSGTHTLICVHTFMH